VARSTFRFGGTGFGYWLLSSHTWALLSEGAQVTTVITFPTDCRTDAAVVRSRHEFNLNTRIIRASEQIFARRPVDPEIRTLTSAILAPFLGRVVTLSDKNWARMIRSFQEISRKLQKWRRQDEDAEQDALKYFHGVLFCRIVGDEVLPPKPEWLTDSRLYKGWAGRIVARSFARKDLSFFTSLMESKRTWPMLGPKREVQAIRDHWDLFVPSQASRVPFDPEMDHFLEHFGRILFHPIALGPPKKFLPSNTACFEAGRKNGGQQSLFQPFDLRVLTRPTPSSLENSLRPKAADSEFQEWRQRTFVEAREKVDSAFRHENAEASLMHVSVQSIAEPSKFRIITKGSGYLYTAVQPQQGQLLRAWKHCRASSMLKTDLTVAVNDMYRATPPSWVWVSVDYKAATDSLARWATLAIARGVQTFDPSTFWRSLSPGLLHYPEFVTRGRRKYPVGLPKGPFLQESGQMMGHPLSFPLLCGINLGCYMKAVDEWDRFHFHRLLSQRPYDRSPEERNQIHAAMVDLRLSAELMRRWVLINGDDGLFRCPADFPSFFERVFTRVGLRKSVGKNYVSSTFAMINSQRFLLKGGVMRRIGYLNMSLVLGRTTKTGVSMALPTQIAVGMNEMIELTPWTACSIPLAMSRWSQDFRGWFSPNWYLPVHLGGYGLEPSGPFKVTRPQRLMAARFIEPGSRLALYRRCGPALIPFVDKFFPELKLIPLEDLSEEREDLWFSVLDREKGLDDWLVRFGMMAKASKIDLDVGTDAQIFGAQKFPRHHRFKPMSDEGFRRWTYGILAPVRPVPGCPDLSSLHFEDVPPMVRVPKSRRQLFQKSLRSFEERLRQLALSQPGVDDLEAFHLGF